MTELKDCKTQRMIVGTGCRLMSNELFIEVENKPGWENELAATKQALANAFAPYVVKAFPEAVSGKSGKYVARRNPPQNDNAPRGGYPEIKLSTA